MPNWMRRERGTFQVELRERVTSASGLYRHSSTKRRAQFEPGCHSGETDHQGNTEG